ncbi:MAG: SBBP repeat-containing protein [bacterium]
MHSIVLDTVAPLLPRESSRSQTQDDGKDSSIVALQEDNQGNTYALGRFNGRMWIGNIQVQTNANQELFITKHNKAGELIWFKQTQSNNRINPTSLVIENNGDIVIGGYFQGDSVFGTASVSSVGYGDNGFFSTLDANGNRKRVKAITNNDGGTNQIFAITTDENNNIYIAGNNTTNGYLDGQVAISTTPSTEIFILKTDSTGNRVRTTQTQNSSNVDQINDIHYDNNGNIYMVGYTDGFVDFGATTLSSP